MDSECVTQPFHSRRAADNLQANAMTNYSTPQGLQLRPLVLTLEDDAI